MQPKPGGDATGRSAGQPADCAGGAGHGAGGDRGALPAVATAADPPLVGDRDVHGGDAGAARRLAGTAARAARAGHPAGVPGTGPGRRRTCGAGGAAAGGSGAGPGRRGGEAGQAAGRTGWRAAEAGQTLRLRRLPEPAQGPDRHAAHAPDQRGRPTDHRDPHRDQQRHRAGQHPAARLLHAAGRRALPRARAGPGPPGAAGPRARRPGSLGAGRLRLRLRQPDHQPDRRSGLLRGDEDPRAALRRGAGARRGAAGPDPAGGSYPRIGGGDPGRPGAGAGHRPDPASLFRRLPADREQHPAAAGLWPQRQAPPAGGVRLGARRRGVVGHPRRAGGDTRRGGDPHRRR